MATNSGKTSFTGRIDAHAKTARPANVGPHDVRDDQHDPDDRGVDPERDYKPRPDEIAGTAGPGTPGKAPVKVASAEVVEFPARAGV